MSGFWTQTKHFSASATAQRHSPSHQPIISTLYRGMETSYPLSLWLCGGTFSLLLSVAVTEDTSNLPDNLSALQEIKKLPGSNLVNRLAFLNSQKNKTKQKNSSIKLSWHDTDMIKTISTHSVFHIIVKHSGPRLWKWLAYGEGADTWL